MARRGSNNGSSIKRGELFMIDEISEFEIMNSTKTGGIPPPPHSAGCGRKALGKISIHTYNPASQLGLPRDVIIAYYRKPILFVFFNSMPIKSF
jgi:hypothetical protein